MEERSHHVGNDDVRLLAISNPVTAMIIKPLMISVMGQKIRMSISYGLDFMTSIQLWVRGYG